MQQAVMLRSNQLLVEVRNNKIAINGKRTDQRKQGLSLCPIGLVKNRGKHVVN